MDLTQEYTYDIAPRFKYITWIVGIVFLVIMGRLYYLQVVKGSHYRFFSERNSIKDIKAPAARGLIFCADGEVIVDDRLAFDVVIIPQYVADKEKVVSTLSNILGLERDYINERLIRAKNFPAFSPVTIKADASFDEVAKIRAFKTPSYTQGDEFDFRGIDVLTRYARVYPDGDAMSHLLGYLREIDPAKLKAYSEKYGPRYEIGDYIGIGGIEEEYDLSLRGWDGFVQKAVNAFGREVAWSEERLLQKEPQNGMRLKLSILQKLQKTAKEQFKGKIGSAVAIDPSNGEVLLFYSSPTFDLNKMSSPDGSKYWQEISSRPEKVVLNRGLQGFYPPGSTFKIVTAIAALEEGIIKPDDKLFCGGGLKFGNRFYKCWRKGGHGNIPIIEAIASSCDTFFYQLGLKLGVDRIAKYAKLLSLGEKTSIDLPNERSGLIPTSEWKERTRNEKWQEGENLSVAVGQGYDSVTPLQNAVMAAIIANGGKKISPHVVRALIDPDDEEAYPWHEIKTKEPLFREENIRIVKEGMKGAVESVGGTAHGLDRLNLKIAGKTGTAQVVSREAWRAGIAEQKDHAWFVAYAPYDNPTIAVSVIVEHGGFGASAAAPIAGEIIKEYLNANSKTSKEH